MAHPVPEEFAPGENSFDISPLHRLARRLRDPGRGCPWDRARTLAAMGEPLVGEAREAAEALASPDAAYQCEELGDVLFNVMLAVAIAEEEGTFAWRDVVAGVTEKIVRRHPHVFGGAAAGTPEEAMALFLAAKAEEKGGDAAPPPGSAAPPSRNAKGESMADMPETVDGWPNICGEEQRVEEASHRPGPFYLGDSDVDPAAIQSAWGIALHMQQPLIPAGGGDLKTAAIISNLKAMMDNPGVGDNHNAPVFHWCYKRIGEFVPELAGRGKSPRVMLDYSGCLFYGLPQMGLHDVIDALRGVTSDPRYRRNVEWLGCTWGHAVAPSTPVQDYRLQVKAWQHHFAALFGFDSLARVKGFSPAEMALPNHPDVAYEFVKTLKDCGFLWVMLQEHSLERPEDGEGPRQPYIPNRLVCRNSRGEEISILTLVKTQGSDTKLVAQMQPYYEAKSRGRETVAGRSVPPYVVQIGDGENGGVMMNEFPGMFKQAMAEASGSNVPAMNGTEYIEHLLALGLREDDFPAVQPKWTKLLFEHYRPGGDLDGAMRECRDVDGRFTMDGGSWTNNISWTRGYENVLGPMEKASALFAEKTKNIPASDIRYRKALFHLLCSQTSCYRYWGQGVWTDYGAEICRRAIDILTYDM